MSEELGKISFFLAKEGNNFDSVLQTDKIPDEGPDFKVRSFSVDGNKAKFFCLQSTATHSAPPWIEFINEKISNTSEKIHFDRYNRSPSGLLLLNIDDRILAATFGTKGHGFIDKSKFMNDFGIKTAMNMCGNQELRQTKSSTHVLNTQNIDRQLSQPSEALDFGLNDSEFLKFISAKLETNSNVTLQGKDSLTTKVIGEEKLSWDNLLSYAQTFLSEYKSERYKKLFPNYPNLTDATDSQVETLDSLLIERITKLDFSLIHLAIPEFLADDDFSFTYSNHNKRDNFVFSHLHVDQFKNKRVINLDKLDKKYLQNKRVYAYSHDEDKILPYRNWRLYNCIVAEMKIQDGYFVLTDGTWRKVDDDFYSIVTKFGELSG